jgi:superfamily I DNA and/or RNA helicase
MTYTKGKGKINDKENLVRLSTVDRFQGMERNIIIVSW